jgi:hypothetical protein
MYLGWRLIIQYLVKSSMMVKLDIPANPLGSCPNALIVVEIHVLIFERPPEPFGKNMINDAPSPIHADPNAMRLQESGECDTRKWAPLVAVEDLRRSPG